MSRHIASHLWSDFAKGKLGTAKRAAMIDHANECTTCAAAKAKVEITVAEFAAIANQKAPELGWEAIRTQVGWKVQAQARDAAGNPGAKPWSRRLAISTALVACAGVATYAVVGSGGAGENDNRVDRGSSVALRPDGSSVAPVAAPPEVQLHAKFNRIAGAAIVVDGQRLEPATAKQELLTAMLQAGSVLATGDATVDVQVSESTHGEFGFALGKNTTATLARFNSKTIELVVDGTLDIDVERRKPGQQFVVIAGTRRITVRGTRFRVAQRGGQVSVWCEHGAVDVDDGKRSVIVGAKRGIELPPDRSGSGDVAVATDLPQPRDLAASELAELVATTPLRLDASAAALVVIPAQAGRVTRLDGVEVGVGTTLLRATAGRHRVEAADGSGRFRGAWLNLVANELATPRWELPNARSTRRRSELSRLLSTEDVLACARALTKQGLGGATVALEISVTAAGAVSAVTTVDSEVASSVANCIRNLVLDLQFEPGASVSWVERFTL